MARNDRYTWAAIACVVVGWFFLNTFVATFGPIRHSVHFYELAPVIRDPSRLVFGIKGAFGLSKFLFGLVCVAVIVAPLFAGPWFPDNHRAGAGVARTAGTGGSGGEAAAAQPGGAAVVELPGGRAAADAPPASRRFQPVPFLMHTAPLLLMLLCGIVLYVKSSSTHIEAGPGMGRIGGYLAKWANSAQDWTGDVVARHIAVGAGGALSFLASAWLAFRGMSVRCHTSVTPAP